MSRVKPIKEMINDKYGTEVRLARDLGWTKQHLNKITMGVREPDLHEVQALAEKLDKSFEAVANIFLEHSHQTSNTTGGE